MIDIVRTYDGINFRKFEPSYAFQIIDNLFLFIMKLLRILHILPLATST